MALIDSAVNGLLGAVVAGGVSVALWWRGRPKRSQLDDAWRKQADELDKRLSKQFGAEIGWLRTQLAGRDALVAAKDAQLGERDTEIRRLNQLLNQERRPGGG